MEQLHPAVLPPDLEEVGYTWTEDGERIDLLSGLRADGLLGASVWRKTHEELGRDGQMHPVFKGGVVVWYTLEEVSVIEISRRYGKPSAFVDHFPYEQIEPQQNNPSTLSACHRTARQICDAIAARKGTFEHWERRLLGYAATLARREAVK